MESVGLRALRHDASAVVRRVEHGEEIDITVSGRVVARMVPVGAKTWRTWDEVADLFAGRSDADWNDDRELAISAATLAELHFGVLVARDSLA